MMREESPSDMLISFKALEQENGVSLSLPNQLKTRRCCLYNLVGRLTSQLSVFPGMDKNSKPTLVFEAQGMSNNKLSFQAETFSCWPQLF